MNEDNLSSVSDSLFGIPGLPFLIASVCIVFAIIAAFFVKDIKKGRVVEGSSTSNSQSESDTQTTVDIKSSVADVQEFVEAEDGKYNARNADEKVLKKGWFKTLEAF